MLGAIVNDALALYRARGLTLPKRIEFDSAGFRERLSRAVAGFDPRTDTIFVNAEVAYWREMALAATRQRAVGYWSTAEPLHALLHELGHAAHHRADPIRYREIGGENIPADRLAAIKTGVSGRATKAPREFVAEVMVGNLTGIRYADEIMELYRQYGGIEL